MADPKQIYRSSDCQQVAMYAKRDPSSDDVFPIIKNSAVKITEVGSVTYIALAAPGSDQASAAWQVMKIDETTGMVLTWADGNANFDNVATDLTVLSYS
jgi:hypothetical protein